MLASNLTYVSTEAIFIIMTHNKRIRAVMHRRCEALC